MVQAALRGPGLPRFYANSFAIAQTSSDISVVMLLNDQPVGILSMSYISAKSLGVDLGGALEQIEVAIKQKIPTINETTEALRKRYGGGFGAE
jgi:hypothetical protein